MDFLPSISHHPRRHIITRRQILFTGVITCFGSLLFLIPDFPFSPGFCLVSMISCIFHIFLFFIYKQLDSFSLNFANTFNFVMLGMAIHYSGGILSPFNLIFICVLVASAGFGAHYKLAIASSIVVYLTVAVTEFSGIFPPIDITPQDLYGNLPSTLLVVISTIGFIFTAGMIYTVTIHNFRLKLEQENNVKQSMLNQLSKLEAQSQIGHLVNKIVHDIRGPLGAISGFIQILKNENPLGQESKEDCTVIQDEIKRISNLLGQLTSFTRPGPLQRENLSPIGIIDVVLSIVSFLPGARKIVIRKKLSGIAHHKIMASKEELQQAYFNILKNSIEALRSSKKKPLLILIYGYQKDATLSIVIEDNGPGFPPDKLTEIFTGTYYSLKKEGVGVGLLIAKEILEAHGGTIEVQSEIGKGTKITTHLPLNTSHLKDNKSDILIRSS
ncbi:hypothetical protein BVX98_01620 [bacterium F11]|nr:hypothetical protein BVX98_01620 [bacterium F11]